MFLLTVSVPWVRAVQGTFFDPEVCGNICCICLNMIHRAGFETSSLIEERKVLTPKTLIPKPYTFRKPVNPETLVCLIGAVQASSCGRPPSASSFRRSSFV